MSIHIGRIIERETKRNGVRRKELYEKLNTSRQNLYAIFKRETIDTGILLKLSELLHYNFFKEFFTEDSLKSLVASDDEKANASLEKMLNEIQILQNAVAQKDKQIQFLEQTVEVQNKIIALLEKNSAIAKVAKKKK
ncbi:hypothetical protein A9P82_04450 [Arachidicoccus ginsenosidimutans]|uniref:hypothetical protein n=1 Tax=Arachidicoccus sp. BS20 TaxID=1850526 RepID=UPI0007F14B89|nr:hypothetical protein [Arachidicoccus sp. BS20]ANI88603.1 hypothetical protein A9P82_04450 [Arachidicoccus sp. BS20]